MTCLLGARFGAGGGAEISRAQILSALQAELGQPRGLTVWNDLRELQDPETPTTIAKRVPVRAADGRRARRGERRPRRCVPSSRRWTFGRCRTRSSSARAAPRPGGRSWSRGRSSGSSTRSSSWSSTSRAAACRVRGGSLAGIPNVLIGRGPDYGWSFTSSNSDNIDVFAETLCGGDDRHYLFRGDCRAMTRFDAGVVRAATGETPVSFWETVHGPVSGLRDRRRQARRARLGAHDARARAPGGDRGLRRSRPAASARRSSSSTRSRASRCPSTASTSTRSTSRSRRRDGCRSARLGVDPGLPTVGTGEYEWRGFLAPKAHPQAIDPPGGAIVNWNNKPAPGFAAVRRELGLRLGAACRAARSAAEAAERGRRRRAGDEHRRDPGRARRLRGAAPRGAAGRRPAAERPGRARCSTSSAAWHDAGGSRLDRDLDGKIDDPGAAVLDAAWPRIADALLRPALGPLTPRFLALDRPFDLAMFAGTTRYVDKDLRTLLGKPVRGPFATRFCGGGDLPACRASIWAGDRGRRRRARRGPWPGSRRVALGRHARAHPLRAGPPPGHDAVGEPADVPAGPELRRPPVGRGHGSPQAMVYADDVEKRYLFTPGPTPVPPEVLAATATPIVHHRGPDFRVLYERCLGRLKEVFRTSNEVLLFAASGTGGFESAFANLTSPGDRVLVVSAGSFGERWAAMARAYGARRRPPALRLGGHAGRRRRRGAGARREVRHARALRDLHRRRRGRRGARRGREGRGCARRRRRDLVARRRPGRDGRVGARRGRDRLAEGADDAAGPRARSGLGRRVRRNRHHAALLLRLGAHPQGAGGGGRPVHAGRVAHLGPRRRTRARAGGRPRRRLRAPRAPGPRLPRRREGHGARPVLPGRRSLCRRDCDPDAGRQSTPTSSCSCSATGTA